MEASGFVNIKMVKWTDFYTSPTTRGCLFVAEKPSGDLQARHLTRFMNWTAGLAAAIVVARLSVSL